MKRKLRKLYAIIMSIVILMSMTDLSVYAEGSVVNANNDEQLLPFTVNEGNIEIQFNIVNEWENGYQGEIILKNLSEEVISEWNLNFGTPDKITDI